MVLYRTWGTYRVSRAFVTIMKDPKDQLDSSVVVTTLLKYLMCSFYVEKLFVITHYAQRGSGWMSTPMATHSFFIR